MLDRKAKTPSGPRQSPQTENGCCDTPDEPLQGPRTPEGLLRCKMGSYKHGGRSVEGIAEVAAAYQLLRDCKATIKQMQAES